jgi:SpoVK/Ycf46/Vps4 family AAA+-type ATPase
MTINPELLKRLVRAFIERDDRGFMSAVRQIVSGQRRQGHLRVADDLTDLLSRGSAQSHKATALPSAPRSQRDASSLIEVRQPSHRFDEVVLSHETESHVRRVVAEFAQRERLSHHGLRPKLKLLFFGPPGNGKTLTAHVLASELGLPLFYVRFDALVASYLGETSSNLRRVFEFAEQQSGVLLLDEFDAIGKTRDDPRDVGELKRVVNSFLQMLDNYQGQSPIVAATNYERVLDYALWRRFDAVIHFPEPDEAQIERYLRQRISSVPHSSFDVSSAAQLCAGMSYAEVARVFTDALKSVIISGERSLTIESFKREVEQARIVQAIRGSAAGPPSRPRA